MSVTLYDWGGGVHGVDLNPITWDQHHLDSVNPEYL